MLHSVRQLILLLLALCIVQRAIRRGSQQLIKDYALHAMMQQLTTCITPILLVLDPLHLAKARPTMSYILLVIKWVQFQAGVRLIDVFG